MSYLQIAENATDSRRLYDLTCRDLESRDNWAQDIIHLRDMRLGMRKKSTAYPGAPNWVDPIIDDNVNKLTAMEYGILKSTKNFVAFIPLSPQSAVVREQVETAFNFVLQMMTDFETILNVALDQKNQDGMSYVSLSPSPDNYSRIMGIPGALPEMVLHDPLEVIIPVGCKDLQKASRYTLIYRFTPEQFQREAEVREWNVPEPLQRTLVDNSVAGARVSYGREDKKAGRKVRYGITDVPDHENYIIVWRTFGYASDGSKKSWWYCIEYPDEPLQVDEWVWENGEEREWELYQFRFENRNQDLLDVRGVANMLRDNQQAANQFNNLKGIMFDFTGKPAMRKMSDFVGNAQTVRFLPGEDMTGWEIVENPDVSQQFNFEANFEREKAERRVGSMSSAVSGENPGRDRITATEVQRQSLNSQILSVNAIQRFSRTLSKIFSGMWNYLRHNPIPLPFMSQDMKQFQMLPESIYQLPFLVISSASARSADPIFRLQQLTMLQPYLINEWVHQDVVSRYAINLFDPFLADIAVPQDGRTKIEQVVQVLGQELVAVKEAVQHHQKNFEGMDDEFGRQQLLQQLQNGKV